MSNCPFDALAQKHRPLVCSLNLDYGQGAAAGVGCCVKVQRAKGANTDHLPQ